MKKGIHPKYYSQAKITCSCGAQWITGATKESLEIEACSQCHPFYTGKQKTTTSTGRVARFNEISKKTTELQKERKGVKSKEVKKEEKAKKQEKVEKSSKK